ncbi:MAG: hypothetical protein Q8O89_04870 [Nanoarchaeota archaeon]|nr:hypothetical protein [Nanoarchaeota archaeon]
MKKRGQIIGLFIIIGIILVAITTALIYTEDIFVESKFTYRLSKMGSFEQKAKSVQHYIESCYRTADVEKAYIPPIEQSDYPLDAILARDLSQQAQLCLAGLKKIDLEDTSMKYGHLTYKILSANPLTIEYHLPVTMWNDEAKKEFETSVVDYPVMAGELADFIKTFKESADERPESIPLVEHDSKIIIKKVTAQTVFTKSNARDIATYYLYDPRTETTMELPVVHRAVLEI